MRDVYRKESMRLFLDIFVTSALSMNVPCATCDCTGITIYLPAIDPFAVATLLSWQAEFLRDALYRFLPSVTLERVNRVIKRLQAGKFEGTLGRDTGSSGAKRCGVLAVVAVFATKKRMRMITRR